MVHDDARQHTNPSHSTAQLREIFPDYPCGRKGCRFAKCPERADGCTAANGKGAGCLLFYYWFAERWELIREGARKLNGNSNT